MLRYQGKICPMIRKIVEKAKKDAVGWTPIWHGDSEYSQFSITDGTDTYAVNLIARSCACRKWDLSGIPCAHAITVIFYNQANPDDYVAHWYRLVYNVYFFVFFLFYEMNIMIMLAEFSVSIQLVGNKSSWIHMII